MKKQSYESPEAEILEIELEFRLLAGYGYQNEKGIQVEYDENL